MIKQEKVERKEINWSVESYDDFINRVSDAANNLPSSATVLNIAYPYNDIAIIVYNI